MKKASKDAVDYTDHGTYKEHCSKCAHYVDGGTCEVVEGDVAAGGWCKRFKRDNQ